MNISGFLSLNVTVYYTCVYSIFQINEYVVAKSVLRNNKSIKVNSFDQKLLRVAEMYYSVSPDHAFVIY